MSLEKKVSGQSFEIFAKEWNNIADTVKWVEERKQNFGGKNFPTGAQNVQVVVENSTGSDLDAGSIVALTGLALIPDTAEEIAIFFANSPVLDIDIFADVTAEDVWKTPLAILYNGIADGEAGNAFILGVVPVLVEVGDEDHEFCGPVETSLESLTSGFSGPCKILWKPSGTGQKESVVLLQDFSWRNGVPQNPYVIDRSNPADDTKEWNPSEDKPATWKNYDGVQIKTRVLRYTSGTGAKLEYIDEIRSWLTKFSPVIGPATVTLATTSTC